MPSIDQLRVAIDTFTVALEELGTRAPKPQPTKAAGADVLRHPKPDGQLMAYLKCVRAASSLNAALALLENGYTFEVGTLCRCIDEGTEDILFLALAPGKDDTDFKYQEQLVAEFYDDELEHMAQPMEAAAGRNRVPRRIIHAALARLPVAIGNPSDSKALMQSLTRTLSGFVHGAYVHIMELYGGNPPRFHLSGMPDTPRIEEMAEQLASTAFRAMGAFEIVATLCKAGEFRDTVKVARMTLAEQGGLVVPEQDAAKHHAKLKARRSFNG